MKQLQNLMRNGALAEAIVYLSEALKEEPLNIDYRSSFIELLCIDGQIERADKQLDMLVRQHPECLGGASSLRQLLRAAQARIDFARGGDTVTLIKQPDDAFKALLKIRLSANSGEWQEAATAAEQLETERRDAAFMINETSVTTLRDIDDTLCDFIELFGTNGGYYVIPVGEIERLLVKPVSSLVEMVWRRVEVEIKNGPCGDAFIPVTYLNSVTDKEKLGQETDWYPLTGTEVYVGRGQKLWLVDDKALPLTELISVTLKTETVQSACAV